jgi:WD40 repeat protein
LAFSPDRKTLAAASITNSIELLPMELSATSRTIDVEGGVTALNFSPDGLWLAATGGRGVKVWQQDRTDAVLSGFPEKYMTVAVTSLGRCIALTLDKKMAQLWDITVDKQVSTFRHSHELTSAALSKNGQVAVTATSAGDLWIWKAPYGFDRPQSSETLLTRIVDTPRKTEVKVSVKTDPIHRRQPEQKSEVRPPLGLDFASRTKSPPEQPSPPAVSDGAERDPASPSPTELHAGAHPTSRSGENVETIAADRREGPDDQKKGEKDSGEKKNIFRKVIGLFK